MSEAHEDRQFGLDRRQFLQRSCARRRGPGGRRAVGSRPCGAGSSAAGAGAATPDYGELDVPALVDQERRVRRRVHRRHQGLLQDSRASRRSTCIVRRPDACSRTRSSQSGKAFVVHLRARHHVRRRSTRAPTSIIDRRAVPEEPVRDHEPGRRARSRRPQDMIGKKIGVQATNEAVWNAFLKANNIDPSQDHQGAGAVRPARRSSTGRGRRLVLVRHQRAEPAEAAGRRRHVRSCSPTTSTRSCRRPTS